MFTAREVIGIAIQIEENGERFYRNAIAAVDTAETQDLLRWLADEEARHGQFFTAMKDSIARQPGDDRIVRMGEQLLRAMVQDRLFSLDTVQFDTLTTEAQLIAAGLELEHDSIRFYELLLSFIDDPATADQVTAIIEEERRHVDALTDRLSAGAAERSHEHFHL